jgi:hypothetical protein
MWRIAVPVGVLAIALASANAAGASRETSAGKWADTFCGAISTWQKTIKKGSSTLSSTVAGAAATGDLKAARAKLVGYLHGAVVATRKMSDTVSHAGAPAVPNGGKLQTAVIAGFGSVAAFFQKAAARAAHIPTTSAASFAQATIALGRDISAGAQKIGAALGAVGNYSSPTLDKALRGSKTCKAAGIT